MNQIVFNNVQKKYDKKIVFDDMNLNIDLNGEIISLLGPNGAGKTTLLKMIAGILFCNQGEIAYYDNVSSKKIEGEKYIKWANENVAYLSPSERYLSYKNTARDNILYYSFLKGIPKKKVTENMDEFCSMLNCSHLLDQRIEELSTGQKKIVKIISIFCTDLPVLLLDEPTLGLDVDARENLLECVQTLVNNTNCRVIISSHDLDFVSKITYKHIFIFEGKIREIIDHKIEYNELLKKYKEIKGEAR